MNERMGSKGAQKELRGICGKKYWVSAHIQKWTCVCSLPFCFCCWLFVCFLFGAKNEAEKTLLLFLSSPGKDNTTFSLSENFM
jgi:hypothetical protein